jgi:hypothetical protein
MNIEVGATYVKGNRKRKVLGFESYFVVYETATRIVYQARWEFQKWLKGAVKEDAQNAQTTQNL